MLKIKTILTATIGNAIVYYDMTLYGFFAVYLSQLFFPSDNPFISQLASLAVFASGFLARPFGGLAFGYIGDRYGRKKALVIAILLITIPTAIIGILPTYETIGIMAPLILAVCKLLQGICTGGEYSGAAIFLSEHNRGKGEAFAGSILPVSSIIGALLGTSLGGLCLLPDMPTWAWRIPFLFGGVLGIIGYFLRSSLVETPEFLATQREKKVVKIPIFQVIRQDKGPFICATAISAYCMVLFWVPVVYIVQFMLPKETLASSSMFLNTGFMMLLILIMPLMGLLADRWGRVPLMTITAVACFVVALPLFFMVDYMPSLTTLMIVLGIFSLVISASVVPTITYLPALFPTQERYSAMAMAIGLGEAIGGGVTPFMCHGFVWAFGTPIAPAFYMMVCSVLGFIAIIYSDRQMRMLIPHTSSFGVFSALVKEGGAS